MRRRHLLALGATTLAATGVIGAASLLTVSAAAEANATGDSFATRLAQKLGIDESKVQSAVESTRSEIRDEMQAKAAEEVAQAVKDGKLTQRQADLLKAIQEVREANFENGERPGREALEGLRDLTAEERQAKMEEIRMAREQEMVATLNEKGLNTNAEEIQTLHESLRDADLGRGVGFGGRKGPGGPGRLL